MFGRNGRGGLKKKITTDEAIIHVRINDRIVWWWWYVHGDDHNYDIGDDVHRKTNNVLLYIRQQCMLLCLADTTESCYLSWEQQAIQHFNLCFALSW